MPVKALAPQASASTNFATRAQGRKHRKTKIAFENDSEGRAVIDDRGQPCQLALTFRDEFA